MTQGLMYVAAILALTFGVPLSLQPVFAMADQISSIRCVDDMDVNSPAGVGVDAYDCVR